MKVFNGIILLLGLLLSAPAGNKEPQEISLIRLIANPEKFDGQLIKTIGFLRIEPEGTTLSVSFEDYQHGIAKNSVWIDLSADMNKNSELLDMNYVLVVGIYRAQQQGHMACCSGTVTEISRAMQWSQLKNPRRGKTHAIAKVDVH